MIFNEDEFDPWSKKARSAIFGAPITPLGFVTHLAHYYVMIVTHSADLPLTSEEMPLI